MKKDVITADSKEGGERADGRADGRADERAGERVYERVDGNIMLFGAPMTGKTIFARNLMLKEIDNGCDGIYVTTNDTGEEIVEWFKEFGVSVKVIDCISKTVQPDCTDTELIKRVASPVDFTGVSVRVGEYLKENFRERKRSVVVFDSLSSFLMYTNLQAVYRFLHVITRRMKITRSKSIFIVQEGMHDDRTVATLKQMFDCVIEVKEEEDRKLFRCVYPTHKTPWREFSIDGKRVVM